MYLHNRLVHSNTKKTPFEGYYGQKPDLLSLKLFGARVCVKRTGNRHGKLDRHNFTGIFIGYAAKDQNVLYLDLDSGIVKTSHHTQFDEAWYLQPSCPPAAQLLYDLGLETHNFDTQSNNGTYYGVYVPWPPLPPKLKFTPPPPFCRMLPLPLCETGMT